MSGMYNEYCMKFKNEEIKKDFYDKFSKEIQAKIICIAEDGAKINFESSRKIETVAFDEKENIAIMFLGYQTSIYVFDKEIMFIDEDSKGTYTISDVYENVVYEGRMREMSHEQMLGMFVKLISCLFEATSVHITQLEVPELSGYHVYNYYEPHMFIIDVENSHAEKHSQTFENITINY